MIITIDGPAGSGKSTVARLVAAQLRYLYIDSGALYRALAYVAHRDKIRAYRPYMRTLSIRYAYKNNAASVYVNGVDVSCHLRDENVSKHASLIATMPIVRKYITNLQRTIAFTNSVVVEGRDTGSVVFPYAERKFYMDASARERAQRRYKELIAKGVSTTFEKILKTTQARDRKDMSRTHSPLTQPHGCVMINTTRMTIDNVVKTILQHIKL